MRPPESFLGQPIRNLQNMLRVISRAGYRESGLVPDGIYGQNTARAVADFQQEHSLPATGVADLPTWEAIFSAYVPASINLNPACPLYILLNPNQVIRKGERHSHLYVIQGMLAVLSRQFASIDFPSFTGLLDDATESSLISFQKLCSLPATGYLDKITWKHLALQYPLAANLLNLPDAPDRKTQSLTRESPEET